MPLKNKMERGFALIESMVAIVVVALGILGIIGVQMRTLADTQTGVRRAQAIRLIEDLSERLKVNPNALGNIASYEIAAGPQPAPPNCKTNPCSAQNLALADIRNWRQTVVDALPLGDAVVFQVADEALPTNHRQLGVLLSWRENERADGTAAENAAYKNVFNLDATGVAGASCPSGRSCHLQYIQLTSRCSPYLLGGVAAPTVFCPF